MLESTNASLAAPNSEEARVPSGEKSVISLICESIQFFCSGDESFDREASAYQESSKSTMIEHTVFSSPIQKYIADLITDQTKPDIKSEMIKEEETKDAKEVLLDKVEAIAEEGSLDDILADMPVEFTLFMTKIEHESPKEKATEVSNIVETKKQDKEITQKVELSKSKLVESFTKLMEAILNNLSSIDADVKLGTLQSPVLNLNKTLLKMIETLDTLLVSKDDSKAKSFLDSLLKLSEEVFANLEENRSLFALVNIV